MEIKEMKNEKQIIEFNKTKEQMYELLQEIGIQCDETDKDFDLKEYIEDSLQFINFIVSVEEKFGIEIPDEYLMLENLSSINGFINFIQECIEMNA